VNLGLAQNETITFTLTNGRFADPVLYVLCGTTLTGTAPQDVKVADQIDGGNGEDFITFRFNDSTIRGGANNYMDISRDGVGCGAGTYANLAIRSIAGLAPGAAVTVAVTDARTVSNQVIQTALTPGASSGNLLQVIRQFNMNGVPDGTTSNPRMISIAEDLKLFVDGPQDQSQSYFAFSNTYSRATWVPTHRNNNWHGGNIRTAIDTATATFTLTGAPSAVYAVDYDGYTCAPVGANWVCSIPSTLVMNILATPGDTEDRYITVYVDTTTPIENATLTATLDVNFDSSAFLDRSFSFTNAVWQREGTTLHIPFVKSNLPLFETYIKLQTKSSIPNPPVLAAVLCGDGSVQTGTLGPIVAGTPLLITGTELMAVCTGNGRTVDGANAFAATLTVNAKEVDMFGYANTCYQGDVGCRRIPVKTQRGFFEIIQSGVVSE